MPQTILITGYGGFVAKHLSAHLVKHGYLVKGLSHNKTKLSKNVFYWNVEENYIDEKSLENVDYLIHLAGAGIADKRWTDKRKKEIIDSRVKSAELLASTLRHKNIKLKGLIGISAIGYYGAVTTDKIFTETDLPGTDFLAECCVKWENAYNLFNDVVERKTILRLGTVVGKDGGALKKLMPLTNFGLASSLGSGKQIMPFINVKDLSALVEFCIAKQNINGIFNAVAPQQPNNNEFMKTLASSLHKPFIMPAVPAFLMKLILGEMAVMLLEGSRVSNDKIIAEGFTFSSPTIKEAFNLL
ncbi:MAG: TIGR01777 family oxidoreductase [Bacteroidia bacterium]